MKLLVLSPSFYLPGKGVRVGGGEISNFLLLEQLVRRGHEVCVIAIHGEKGFGTEVSGIKLFNVSSKVALPGLGKVAATALYRKEARKIARDFRPDTILSITNATATGVELKKSLKVPLGVLLRAENDLIKSCENGTGLKSLLLRVCLGHVSNRLLMDANFLLVNSQYMKKVFTDLTGNGNIHVVYPPVDDEQRPIRVPNMIRKVISVGTSERKGFGIVRELSGLLPELEFHVVGNPSIPAGESRRQENLKISGWMPDRSVYLDPADLVLVPSVWNEPFGRIAVEALRYGRIVLVSDKGGLPEVVDHQEDLVVSSLDPKDWSRRIEAMNQNMKYYTGICNLASQHTACFTLKEQTDNLEQILMINNS